MMARQPHHAISLQAPPSLSPNLSQSTISEALPPGSMVTSEKQADKYGSESGASSTTSPVQRMLPTIAIQRQITDELGNEYDFDDDPPDWFIDLSKRDQGRVLSADKQLGKLGKTRLYTKVLSKLGIALEADSDEEEGGEYTEKRAKRTGKPGKLFEKVYNVNNLKRTGSGLGLETMCEEKNCVKPSRKIILEDNPNKKKARYHERGYTDHYGESRKPPICHSEEHPAAWVLSALEDMINNSNGNGYGSASAYQTTQNYKNAKKTVEWELPKLTVGHTQCNLKHKDKLWSTLSQGKQNKLKKEVFEHLENKGLVSGSWNNPKWL
ncbi:MAG TPA: hypothetical protein VEX13_15725 [Chloroflexia bacterium]|nr:hypothetical protein [Chloroflexia bacterium]